MCRRIIPYLLVHEGATYVAAHWLLFKIFYFEESAISSFYLIFLVLYIN